MSKSQQLQIRVSPAQKARLRRLAAAAGVDVSAYVLQRALPGDAERFEELVHQAADAGRRSYALAELNDLLAQAPAGVVALLSPGRALDALDPVTRNYVAAMVEQAAHLKGVRPAPWAAAVEPLEQPWFAAPLRSLRPWLIRRSPAAFKRRNLFVDASIGSRV